MRLLMSFNTLIQRWETFSDTHSRNLYPTHSSLSLSLSLSLCHIHTLSACAQACKLMIKLKLLAHTHSPIAPSHARINTYTLTHAPLYTHTHTHTHASDTLRSSSSSSPFLGEKTDIKSESQLSHPVSQHFLPFDFWVERCSWAQWSSLLQHREVLSLNPVGGGLKGELIYSYQPALWSSYSVIYYHTKLKCCNYFNSKKYLNLLWNVSATNTHDTIICRNQFASREDYSTVVSILASRPSCHRFKTQLRSFFRKVSDIAR